MDEFSGFGLPNRTKMKEHCLRSLSRYWPETSEHLTALPIRQQKTTVEIELPLVLKAVELPEWASDCGINGKLLIPREVCSEDGGWQSVDWWSAVYIMLECWHERELERISGPIHSYSIRLKHWDTRVWEAAWVNRIALFLRRWCAIDKGKPEQELFGKRPVCEIYMTHDVDAISKTVPIRLKQGAFNLFNCARSLLRGDIVFAKKHLFKFFSFLFGVEEWCFFDRMLDMEKKVGIKARFYFFAKTGTKTYKSWFFDPSYSLDEERVVKIFKQVIKHEGQFGLHPGFESWCDEAFLRNQRLALSNAIGDNVTACRQHWLRFSWERTWQAQGAAGLHSDATLMFNDRPGFRAAAALNWYPWDQSNGKPHSLLLLPTVLMDSHVYDYQPMNPQQRWAAMSHWIRECESVGGQMAVLWHPHTLSADYDWEQGFEQLLSMVAATRLPS